MAMQAIPVRVEKGIVRSVDGSPLPERANALLVIMPAVAAGEELEEWQRPFDDFFEAVRRNPRSKSLDAVSDADLNQLVHSARRT